MHSLLKSVKSFIGYDIFVVLRKYRNELKSLRINMKKLSLLLFAAAAFANVNAQKLPAIQQKSLRAPADIKIDGKAIDWGNKFEARNPTTELLYTIANDDKKVYLVVQTDVNDVYNRISNGGIKLVIQKNGRKNEDGAAIVKFPFQEKPGELTFNSSVYLFTVSSDAVDIRKTAVQKPVSAEQADSIMKANNAKLAAGTKWIYTNNIAGVDTLLSVYNDKGVGAAVAFDNKKVYTLEMAIDLKLLGLTSEKGEKFSYHLVVNGTPNKFGLGNQITVRATSNVLGSTQVTDQIRNANESINTAMAPRYATTDFWGEYTLAK
jgi:hypothetical protein